MSYEPWKPTTRCRIRGMATPPRYRPGMDRREFEAMLAAAVPGEVKGRFAGADDDVLIHSVTAGDNGELHYVTYLQLPPDGCDSETFERSNSAGYAPPTGLGVAIRYQHEFADPFTAGKSFQQLHGAMKHEMDRQDGDLSLIGRAFIESKIQNEADRRLAALARDYEQRVAEHPELAEELEEALQEQIPDEQKREFLRSLYSLTSDHSTDS